MDKAERTAMDERAVEAVATALEEMDSTFVGWENTIESWKNMRRGQARVVIAAYEAAKPAPMSTSGAVAWRQKFRSDPWTYHHADWPYAESERAAGAIVEALVPASRLESLEALFAEQAGELESAESHAQMLLLAAQDGDPKPELAMRVKDLISVLSDIRKARGKE